MSSPYNIIWYVCQVDAKGYRGVSWGISVDPLPVFDCSCSLPDSCDDTCLEYRKEPGWKCLVPIDCGVEVVMVLEWEWSGCPNMVLNDSRWFTVLLHLSLKVKCGAMMSLFVKWGATISSLSLTVRWAAKTSVLSLTEWSELLSLVVKWDAKTPSGLLIVKWWAKSLFFKFVYPWLGPCCWYCLLKVVGVSTVDKFVLIEDGLFLSSVHFIGTEVWAVGLYGKATISILYELDHSITLTTCSLQHVHVYHTRLAETSGLCKQRLMLRGHRGYTRNHGVR